jgi:hypothetical protein
MNSSSLHRVEEFVSAGGTPPRLSEHDHDQASPAAVLAASLAATQPGVRLEVFADWDVVDAARAGLHATVAAERVGVHHRDAFLCASVQTALRASGAIVLQLA